MKSSKSIFENNDLMLQLKKLMWEASAEILRIYNCDKLEHTYKTDKSPVTEADLAAHQILTNGLTKLAPDIPTISEEDKNNNNSRKGAERFWLIDPLDGTKEFIGRNGEFTCNLALIEKHRPELGFVSVPTQGKLFVGGKDFSSTVETRNQQAQKINCKRVKGITRIVASKSHLNDETKAFIENIQGKKKLIQAGSSLKFLKIAIGEADIYPRLAPTCEWDTAAAHAILEGSGGNVLQIDNSPMIYGKENILNPYFIASASHSTF